MKRITYRKWFTVSVALTALSVCGPWSKDAWACPGPTCEAGDVFPTSGTVPANHFGLTWRRLNGQLTAADSLHVYRVSEANPDGGFVLPEGTTDGGASIRELALQFDPEILQGSDGGLDSNAGAGGPVHVTSPAALQAGDMLRVVYSPGGCEEGGEALLFRNDLITLGPPAELPTDLGTLDVETGEGYVDIRIGLCEDRTWVAYATLDVQFSDGARPFADMFMYELLVDGQSVGSPYTDQVLKKPRADWPSRLGGRTAYGETVLLTADCNGAVEDDGLRPPMPVPKGTHSVSVVGFLPDGTRVASEPVDVTLDCGSPVCQDDGYPYLDHPCRAGGTGLLPDAYLVFEGPTWEAGIDSGDDAADTDVPSTGSSGETIDAATVSNVDTTASLDAATPVDVDADAATAVDVDADAATAVDVDAGTAVQEGASASSDGCSCTVGAGSSERGHYAWAGLLLGLSFLRRRGRGMKAE